MENRDNKVNDLYNHFGKPDNDFETIYDDEYYRQIKERMQQRQARVQKRKARSMKIRICLAAFILIAVGAKLYGGRIVNAFKPEESVSMAETTVSQEQVPSETETESSSEVEETPSNKTEKGYEIEQRDGMTFVDGILIVNKTYSLPSGYNPGVSTKVSNAFTKMQNAAADDGINLFINSGFRSYKEQKALYDSYKEERGRAEADKVSSRPGHSEHQTGLTFDVNSTDNDFEYTQEAKWLAKHCAEYGFIIRYPKGKEKFTGYIYEPWHIRYVGEEKAKKITASGLCLEEYLGITSDYNNASGS